MPELITNLLKEVNMTLFIIFLWWVVIAIAFCRDKEFHKRMKRFFYTMVSKKIFAWSVATYFLSIKVIDQTTWAWITIGTFSLDVAQKYIWMNKKTEED